MVKLSFLDKIALKGLYFSGSVWIYLTHTHSILSLPGNYEPLESLGIVCHNACIRGIKIHFNTEIKLG